jgi:hypothetical protein
MQTKKLPLLKALGPDYCKYHQTLLGEWRLPDLTEIGKNWHNLEKIGAEKLRLEQNYHNENRKLNPVIATKASLIHIGFRALNQSLANMNQA